MNKMLDDGLFYLFVCFCVVWGLLVVSFLTNLVMLPLDWFAFAKEKHVKETEALDRIAEALRSLKT